MYEYMARLVRVVDGDTWIFDIDLGCDVWIHGRRIRGASINSPEMSTDAGKTAKAYSEAWFKEKAPDGMVVLRTTKDRNDNYGRLLGTVTTVDRGHTLNADLLQSGNAVRYGKEDPG